MASVGRIVKAHNQKGDNNEFGVLACRFGTRSDSIDSSRTRRITKYHLSFNETRSGYHSGARMVRYYPSPWCFIRVGSL